MTAPADRTTRAKGSRRASLTTLVRRAMTGECALPAGASLLVAVSGGPDSMALLSVLARVGPALDLAVHAHGVDHGLRPDAARELDLAEAFARSVGVPFDRTRVAVPAGANLQAHARGRCAGARWPTRRAARRGDRHGAPRQYRSLRRCSCACSAAPARAASASCPRAPARRRRSRSRSSVLLRARRADVLLHVARHAVPCAHDPSNADPRYLRTAVRREVLPLLAKLDPNVVRHLEALADELVNGEPRGKSLEWASSLPRSTQLAVARLLTTEAGDARVWLPGGLMVSADPRARRSAGSRGAEGAARPRTPGARARVVSEKPSG
ncbi:MAG: tRNA lysidine(34) synthetase TilS [Labilithrix sp.]|nr:tRNA lysidine(34) synthetase TilS [Labilithrix sp.]